MVCPPRKAIRSRLGYAFLGSRPWRVFSGSVSGGAQIAASMSETSLSLLRQRLPGLPSYFYLMLPQCSCGQRSALQDFRPEP